MDLRRTKTKLAESIFSNVENYFSAQPADNRLAIVENLAFTKKIADGVCETTDTACPVNIKSSALKRERRFPDAIGIGAAKCGTGSLMFLDCHPNIVFRDQEARSGTVVHKCILSRISFRGEHTPNGYDCLLSPQISCLKDGALIGRGEWFDSGGDSANHWYSLSSKGFGNKKTPLQMY